MDIDETVLERFCAGEAFALEDYARLLQRQVDTSRERGPQTRRDLGAKVDLPGREALEDVCYLASRCALTSFMHM